MNERDGNSTGALDARTLVGGPKQGVWGGEALHLPSVGDVERLSQCSGNCFVVVGRSGDIAPAGARELGLFHDDTRHLSHYALRIDGADAIRLAAGSDPSGTTHFDLMLSDLEFGGVLEDPQNFLHIHRSQVLADGFAEQITLTNFLHRSIGVRTELQFAADFADVFEVRGAGRKARGTPCGPRVERDRVWLGYDGLDGLRYETGITFDPAPDTLDGTRAGFAFELAAGDQFVLHVTVQCARSDLAALVRPVPFARRLERARRGHEDFVARCTRIESSDVRLQSVLDRSLADLHSLRVEVNGQWIIAAGIPWFCAPFGRDSLLASIEALPVAPQLAIETLRTLARYQATETDPEREAEPGKILHELRRGEMARTGEIPHRPYYGSVDATPLWIVALDETYAWTGALDLVAELRGNLARAVSWLDAQSREGGQFVRYRKLHEKGLDNQGWKDSRAGVSFASGEIAEAPIALVEVQGYAFDAYRRAARLFAHLGDADESARCARAAERLRARVESEFWLQKLGRYAMAIDGHGRALDTVASNQGHLLWSGLPTPERARRTARMLTAPATFSGYGIRTVAEGQTVYNPLSYHNGTVWPHDNALIARGLASYGHVGSAVAVFRGLYAAATHFSDDRLPELFCGMPRGGGSTLVPYPVSCSPQAWSAAAPYMLLQAILGLHPDAPAHTLRIRSPSLPDEVSRLAIHDLRVGESRVSMRLRRVGRTCHVERLDVDGAPLHVQVEMGNAAVSDADR